MTTIHTDDRSSTSPDFEEDEEHTGETPVGRRYLLLGLIGLSAAACRPGRPTPPTPTASPGPTASPSASPTASVTPSGSASPTPSPTADPTATPTPEAPPGPLATVLSQDQELHVLRRATFGLTPTLVADIQEQGIESWLDRQLNPSSIGDGLVDDLLKRFSALNWTAKQIYETAPEDGGDYAADLNMVEATIVRNVWSNRQLLEKVVEFWTNHFSVPVPNNDDSWGRKTVEDREVIRRLAFGNLTDLLIADAKSPAMLRYLNNEGSRGEDTNENYGRELLELHTVGLDAGYTEDDVKNAAKTLTGFTINYDTATFQFRPDWHYVGPVKVLDWASLNDSPEGGLEVGESLLSYLASHPSTLRHIATKLARHFVSDVPSESLVDKLTRAFVANDNQIAPVIRTLFLSEEFQASIGQKVRRPLESLTAAMRVLDFQPESKLLDNTEDRSLYYTAERLGQKPMGWQPPNGYPDVMGYWLSSARFSATWNGNHDLVYGGFEGHVTTPQEVFDQLLDVTTPTTAGAVLDRLVARLLFQEITPQTRATLLESTDQAENAEVTSQEQVRNRLQSYTRAIFDSPHFLQR